MDMSAMKKDLVATLKLLPQGMLNPPAIVAWLLANRKHLDKFIPVAMEKLMPHIATAAMEGATGILDGDDIERTCMAAVLEYGKDLGLDVSQISELMKTAPDA